MAVALFAKIATSDVLGSLTKVMSIRMVREKF
jgi:hypothetical protein